MLKNPKNQGRGPTWGIQKNPGPQKKIQTHEFVDKNNWKTAELTFIYNFINVSCLLKKFRKGPYADLYSLIPFLGSVTFGLLDYCPRNGTFGTFWLLDYSPPEYY